jgi:hypothetical protein
MTAACRLTWQGAGRAATLTKAAHNPHLNCYAAAQAVCRILDRLDQMLPPGLLT